MVSDNKGDNSAIELEVQAPQVLKAPVAPHRRRWSEENKLRVMDFLTFKGKDLEDISFSAVIHIAAPMFCTSLLSSQSNNPFLLVVVVTTVLIAIASWWVITVVPESTALGVARLSLIAFGAILGVSL